MTAPDPQFDPADPAEADLEHAPEMVELNRLLELRAREMRERSGLVDRVFEASVPELAPPASIPFTRTRRRLAMAAGLLIAFGAVIQYYLPSTIINRTAPGPGQERMLADASLTSFSPFSELDGIGPTESDTVLVTLLDAGSSGQFSNIDDLQGSDPVGAAFAPLLGTTGIDFDDYMAEISQIEGELRR